MSATVWLMANTFDSSESRSHLGGQLWVYLNWALGLRALGCRVIWIETVSATLAADKVQPSVGLLKNILDLYRAADGIAVISKSGERLPFSLDECVDLDASGEADVLLNVGYRRLPAEKRFRRSVLIDIDPGLTQIWLSEGHLDLDEHDLYYSIGETVGTAQAQFPDCGRQWHYTPPPVSLSAWPLEPPGPDAAYTTVTHWWGESLAWHEHMYENGKREGFLPFLDVALATRQPLELAVFLEDKDDDDRRLLLEKGWRVRDPYEVAATPANYQQYVQDSLGEFSCVKPSCLLLRNAWISDRTLCYLASGKPAIVQHTGPSRFLPDAAGLFRFRNPDEAVHCLETVESDYEHQCKLARALAEEYFNAPKVVRQVMERACD